MSTAKINCKYFIFLVAAGLIPPNHAAFSDNNKTMLPTKPSLEEYSSHHPNPLSIFGGKRDRHIAKKPPKKSAVSKMGSRIKINNKNSTKKFDSKKRYIPTQKNISNEDAKKHHPNPLDIFSTQHRSNGNNTKKRPKTNNIIYLTDRNASSKATTYKHIEMIIASPTEKQKSQLPTIAPTIPNTETAKADNNASKPLTLTGAATILTPNRKNNKTIYLTFDDGPSRGTLNVIKIFQEEKIPVTMFCIGKMVEHNRAIFDTERTMPNLYIANHTYSHANGHYARFYSNKQLVLNDVNRAHEIIKDDKYLRLAGRNVWRLSDVKHDDYAISKRRREIEVPAYDLLAKNGYRIFGWDIEWHFNPHNGRIAYGAYKMISRLNSFYKNRMIGRTNKVILLAHDFMFSHKYDAKELKTFIELLKKGGWSFAAINAYTPNAAKNRPEIKERTLPPGSGSESQPHSPLDIFRLEGLNLKNDGAVFLRLLHLTFRDGYISKQTLALQKRLFLLPSTKK